MSNTDLSHDLYVEDINERVYDILENYTSHPSGKDVLLSEAMNSPSPDYEHIETLLVELEADEAKRHFYNTGQLSREQEYPDIA